MNLTIKRSWRRNEYQSSINFKKWTTAENFTFFKKEEVILKATFSFLGIQWGCADLTRMKFNKSLSGLIS